jgi:two-component system, response regulator
MKMEHGEFRSLFGKAIRRTRSELRISQEELADRAGLHRTYVSDVERGRRNISLESIQKLAHALRLSAAALFQRAKSGSGSDRPVEILIVEDNPTDLELALRAFEKAKITNPVHVARDGAEALEFIFDARHVDEWRKQKSLVILLDLALPRVSGLEVLRHLKADARTEMIPVIVLTSSQRDRDAEECRRLGAQHYIVKPVGFENFSEITPSLALGWTLVGGSRRRAA